MNAVHRYALRTLYGPWFALPTLGLDIALAFTKGMPYLGEDKFTVKWMAASMWILATVAAAGAATDAARLSKPGSIHLSQLANHRRSVYLWSAAWTAIPIVLAHSLVIGVALLAGGVYSPRNGWPAVVIAVVAQGVVVCWFAALGSAIGRHLPVLIAGIAAALPTGILLLSLPSFYPSVLHFEVFGDIGAGGSQLGTGWDTVVLCFQIILLISTAAALVLPRPRQVRGRLALSARGVMVSAAALALLACCAIAISADDDTLVVVAPDRCDQGSPEVCHFHEHSRLISEVTAYVSELDAAAREQGYSALEFERYSERTYTSTSMAGGGVIEFDPLDPDGLDRWMFVQGLLAPVWCTDDEMIPDEYFGQMDRLTLTWIRLADPSFQPGNPEINPVPLTPDEVSRVLSDFKRCELGSA